MHGGVLEALTVREYLVDIGVSVDGPLQRLRVGVPQGELQSLVGVALSDEERSGWRAYGVDEVGSSVWMTWKGESIRRGDKTFNSVHIRSSTNDSGGEENGISSCT